jgi:simple sugar transport system ATP-binding protein
MSEPILELKNIQKHFGMVIALAGVSIAVREEEVHCLLGDNGAGKSSLIKTMAGVHQPSSGRFFWMATKCRSPMLATRSIAG